jgi:hypothetical protein
MDSLDRLRAKISGFPGYAEDLDRRRSDQLVRSYLGEALSELAARLEPLAPAAQAQIDALLWRTEFADLKAFKMHDNFERDGVPDGAANADIAADDLQTVELADRAPSVDVSTLTAYLNDVGAALERRDAAMRAAAS